MKIVRITVLTLLVVALAYSAYPCQPEKYTEYFSDAPEDHHDRLPPRAGDRDVLPVERELVGRGQLSVATILVPMRFALRPVPPEGARTHVRSGT